MATTLSFLFQHYLLLILFINYCVEGFLPSPPAGYRHCWLRLATTTADDGWLVDRPPSSSLGSVVFFRGDDDDDDDDEMTTTSTDAR